MKSSEETRSHSDELARQLIQEAEVSGTIVEMGCGAPIYDALCDQPGSSVVAQEGLCPNGKERQERVGRPKDARSVSKESVEGILHHVKETRGDITTLVSSWQIPSNPAKPVDTHGWMAINHNDRELFAHITFDVGRSRSAARASIANAGLNMLLSKGDPDEIGCIYADQMTDAENNNLIAQVLAQFEHLPEDAEHLVLIDENGNLKRPMDYFREMNQKGRMSVYKGSFNPITKAHVAIAQKSEAETGVKPVFMISMNNYTKGKVPAEEICKRIQLINQLGYAVMVCSDGTFVGNMTMFKKRGYNGQLIYVAGGDTAAKLSHLDKKKLKEEGHKVYLASRDGSEEGEDTELFRRLHVDIMPFSSTQIRNREEGWREGVPEDAYDLYMKLFGKEGEV